MVYWLSVRKKLGCKGIDFVLERPIVSKNIYYAGIITGIVMNYSKNARTSRPNAYFKNKICNTVILISVCLSRIQKNIKIFSFRVFGDCLKLQNICF